MVDRIDQDRHPERVREQDELLALVGARLAHLGQKADRGQPFRFAQLDVAHEIVQMPDQRGHDGRKARIVALGEPLDHRIGQIVFAELPHGASRSSPARTKAARDRLGRRDGVQARQRFLGPTIPPCARRRNAGFDRLLLPDMDLLKIKACTNYRRSRNRLRLQRALVAAGAGTCVQGSGEPLAYCGNGCTGFDCDEFHLRSFLRGTRSHFGE